MTRRWPVVVALTACTPTTEPLPLESKGGATPWPDGETTASQTSSDPSSGSGVISACGNEVPNPPPSIPEGWVPWTCFPGCTYWLPKDVAALPPPILWEPCPAFSSYEGCLQMVTDWSDGEGHPISPDVVFQTDSEGKHRLFVGRLAQNLGGDTESYVEWVVGDVDGDLDFAMRNPWPWDCASFMRDFTQDTFAVGLWGPNHDTDVDAIMVGRLGSLTAEMPYRNTDPGSSAWYVGSERFVKLDYGSIVTAVSPDLSSWFSLYSPAMNPDGTPFDAKPWILGQDIVFQTTSYATAGLWAYDTVRGTHPLVTYPGDPEQGATNLGTDGVDMVWTYGEGKQSNGLYSTVSVMTAPYTTDPDELSPRRLRKDMSLGIGTRSLQFAVGCGYAGRVLATGRDAQIVRLSDGAGWVLAGNDSWRWNQVLGFTCDELFIVADNRHELEVNVARVPLTSLGEPLPAD